MTVARCWVCGGDHLDLIRPAQLPERLTPDNFAITDSNYGQTGALYRCATCGFLECPEVPALIGYYQDLVDPGYEAGRGARELQARALLKDLLRHVPRRERPLRLLDVGCGSGILIGEALRLGIEAEGVEPSAWLSNIGRARGLSVHHGVLPHCGIAGPYDIVCLVDVIEHTDKPLELLQQLRSLIRQDGIVLVVTPDVDSLAARLLGPKWWHYRIAHVGYFSLGTLDRLSARAGLRRAAWSRPGWYFPLTYLLERVERYLPRWLSLPKPEIARRVTFPLNLRDSLACVLRPVD